MGLKIELTGWKSGWKGRSKSWRSVVVRAKARARELRGSKMVLGDYRKNRRKSVFVAEGDLLTYSGDPSGVYAAVNDTYISYISSNIVVDPLATGSNVSGNLTFTAPYSRFYTFFLRTVAEQLSYSYTFTTVTAPVLSNCLSVFHAYRPKIRKNGVLLGISNGVRTSTGAAAGTVVVGPGVLGNPNIVIDETISGNLLQPGDAVATVFLESGDQLSFQFDRTQSPFYLLQTLYYSAAGGGNYTLAAPPVGVNPNLSLGTASVNLKYYIEINEMDRE
jgi:hypothetical protein